MRPILGRICGVPPTCYTTRRCTEYLGTTCTHCTSSCAVVHSDRKCSRTCIPLVSRLATFQECTTLRTDVALYGRRAGMGYIPRPTYNVRSYHPEGVQICAHAVSTRARTSTHICCTCGASLQNSYSMYRDLYVLCRCLVVVHILCITTHHLVHVVNMYCIGMLCIRNMLRNMFSTC